MGQCIFDIIRFADLLSKYTGISKTKIDNYLRDNPISNIIEHPGVLGATGAQIARIEELKELNNLYRSLKLSSNKEYSLDSSSKAGQYFTAYFGDVRDKERFVCSFLDSRNNIISTKVLNIGTVNEAPVYPREIVKEALMHDANTVILAHNHPGCSDRPSDADKAVTKQIIDALNTVKISVMDHIIVAGEKYYSFAERGILHSGSSIRECDTNIFEKVRKQYKTEYPAIIHISENTARIIYSLNQQNGQNLTIKEIKAIYKDAGKKVELNNDKSDMKKFKVLKEVVDDLKRAKFTMKGEKPLIAKKPIRTQLNEASNIELV